MISKGILLGSKKKQVSGAAPAATPYDPIYSEE